MAGTYICTQQRRFTIAECFNICIVVVRMETKLRILIVLLATATVYVVSTRLEHPEEWQLWKTQHGKSYGSQREELERHLVWLSNREYINAHNKNAHILGYSLHLNHFADWRDEEFHHAYLSSAYTADSRQTQIQANLLGTNPNLPLVMDWRKAGVITRVKEQGHCGSSYAFSAVGAIEGAWSLRYGNLVNVSAQNIIDCSGRFGNRGCNGGNMKNSFRYVISNKGINSATYYPYRARKSSCKFNASHSIAYITGSLNLAAGNESQLKMAVANVGPVSVAVDASARTFRFYYRGVYHSQLCSSSTLNHAMLVIGYGTANQRDYWLIKNSWGVFWGIDGYILMARNNGNQCGIASDASFPTLN